MFAGLAKQLRKLARVAEALEDSDNEWERVTGSGAAPSVTAETEVNNTDEDLPNEDLTDDDLPDEDVKAKAARARADEDLKAKCARARAECMAAMQAAQTWMPPVSTAEQRAKYFAYTKEELLEATNDFNEIRKLVNEGKYKWTDVDLQHIHAIQMATFRYGKNEKSKRDMCPNREFGLAGFGGRDH